MREHLPINLRRLLDERGMTQTELAAGIGISSGTLSDWLSGRYYPRTKYIEAMAAFFGVTVDEIVQIKKAPSSIDDEALSLFMKLSDPAKDQVLDYLRYLVKKRGDE